MIWNHKQVTELHEQKKDMWLHSYSLYKHLNWEENSYDFKLWFAIQFRDLYLIWKQEPGKSWRDYYDKLWWLKFLKIFDHLKRIFRILRETAYSAELKSIERHR